MQDSMHRFSGCSTTSRCKWHRHRQNDAFAGAFAAAGRASRMTISAKLHNGFPTLQNYADRIGQFQWFSLYREHQKAVLRFIWKCLTDVTESILKLLESSWQERRHQLIDALSKSQRTRCVPTLPGWTDRKKTHVLHIDSSDYSSVVVQVPVYDLHSDRLIDICLFICFLFVVWCVNYAYYFVWTYLLYRTPSADTFFLFFVGAPQQSPVFLTCCFQLFSVSFSLFYLSFNFLSLPVSPHLFRLESECLCL